VLGTFVNLGSALTAEIMAIAGFDWLVLDLEHGAGDDARVVTQLQALGRTGTAGLVRVESLDLPRFMHALDAGADGVLVPRLRGAAGAATAVEHCRYAGARGLARSNRSWHWGLAARGLDDVDREVTLAVQIETAEALAEVDDIAAIDGVDVLFVGPSDLAHALELHCAADDPRLVQRVEPVAEAARRHGKAAGILTPTPGQLTPYAALGFTFLGAGSDGGILAAAATSAVSDMRRLARAEAVL
jgi:2-dehydro-3-deoxyglucarate aldolase/4-hydroxy-2-oxoheptanedioate aldolase